jgi:hypothetical protein
LRADLTFYMMTTYSRRHIGAKRLRQGKEDRRIGRGADAVRRYLREILVDIPKIVLEVHFAGKTIDRILEGE